jgi:hypothetical protein
MSTTCTPTSRCTPGRRPRSPGAQPAAPPQRRRRLGARVTARGARCRRRPPRRPAARSAPARRPGHARRAARARRGQDRAELGHGRWPPDRAKVSMPARRTANRDSERTRHQAVNWRTSSVQASRARPRYPPGTRPAQVARTRSIPAGRRRGRQRGCGGHRAPPGTADDPEGKGPVARPQQRTTNCSVGRTRSQRQIPDNGACMKPVSRPNREARPADSVRC